MKSLHKIISVLLVMATMSVAMSCKESFTEEDALKAQQAIDIALYIFNQSDPVQAPISGAKVTLSQNGVSKDVTTDATGAALFPGQKVGDFVYRVEVTGFITVAGTGSATTNNFRVGILNVSVGMISTADADLGTIKGTVTMEKDITNLTREPAASVDVFFTAVVGGSNRVFTTKTDATGVYTIKVPINAISGTSYTITYGDFEADQTIAVNQYADETGSFTTIPQVLPRKEAVKTLFSMSTSGEQFRFLPAVNGVRSIIAIADAPPASGALCIVTGVTTNNQGQITDVSFNTGGNYTGDADGKVNITFTSLDGGTGASLVVTLGTNSSVSTAYAGGGTGASKILVGGSGYPINTSTGLTLNKNTTRDPTYRSPVTVQRGTVTIANGDFGTGIYRPRNPQ